jgi:salicylate 5-hydroxylase small subunit
MTSINLETLLLQHRVDQLNAAYGAALDAQRFDEWPLFFLDDGRYKLQSRENFDRAFPLALMDLESRGMMKDRIYGVTQTIYHAPYHTRHVVSPSRVVSVEGEDILSETNYAVFRCRPAGVSEVYNVGRYVDIINDKSGILKFRSRLCVYDSEMVLNSLIYPI